MKITKVALLYPCDPASPLIGGIESFIKGVILNAPENIQYYIIGSTTDPVLRPVGEWSDCHLEKVNYKFYPLYAVKNRGKRSFIPATILYEALALLRMPDLQFFDVVESHRIEHLLLRSINTPFNLFLHQNMAVLNDQKSDILWKFAPRLYRHLETKLFKREGNVFCVREDAVKEYKRVFPDYADKFHFQPTWMDDKIFYPVCIEKAGKLRNKLCNDFGLDMSEKVALAVGRIDLQKDPLLMVDAVASARELGVIVQVIWIGDGVLKERLIKKISEFNLSSQFKVAGLQNTEFIANALRGSDFFLMSSAYEGMPISVLEALACGRPVVSTAVGEVPRLISEGHNGFLAEPGNVDSLTSAILRMVKAGDSCFSDFCIAVAKQYIAADVLQQVYKSYQ